MIKELRKPSKKYNLLFNKYVVILQQKAISSKTRNKSPPLAEAINLSLSGWQKQIRNDNSDCLERAR